MQARTLRFVSGNGVTGRIARGVCILVVVTAVASAGFGADVVSTWGSASTGNWSDPTKWSSDPWFPNNGNNDMTYDAVIGAKTVTLDQNIEIDGLTLNGGTINGNYDLTLATGGTWTGGRMSGGGATHIAQGALLNINGSGTKNLLDWTLDNAGTIALASTGPHNLVGGSGPRIINQSSGTFDIQGNYSLITPYSQNSTIDNAGLFKKSSGTGVSYVGSLWAFNNTGTVQAQSGTLEFQGGGTSTGTFDVSSGAAISFAGGTHELTGVTFTNAGAVNFSGATARFNSPIALGGTVNLSAGVVNFNAAGSFSGSVALSSSATLGGAGDVTIDAGATLTWTGGTMTGGGTTHVAAGAALNIGGTDSKYLLNRTIDNAGTITMTGKGPYNSVGGSGPWISNQSTGVFDVQGDVSLATPYSQACVFDNAGVFKKSSGAGTSQVGSWWTFNNTGAVQAQSGTLEFQGAFSQTAGSIDLAGGNLTFASAAQIAGGEMVGSGTINGSLVNSGGVVDPGHSVGSLTINGGYTQGEAGMLRIDLGGLAAGEFDFVDVNGAASLDGALEVALLGDFRPSDGATFRVMDYTSHTGEFDSVVLLGSADFSFTPQYASDGLTLVAEVLVSVPGDANRDGYVDAADAQLLASHWGQPGGWTDGNFNDDDIVDAADASILAANWAPRPGPESTGVPEPSAIAMIVGLVGLALARRRNR